MNPNVLTAAISAGAAAVTAVVALVVNCQGFTLLDSHLNDVNANLGRRIDDTNASLSKRIDDLRTDVGRLR